MAVGEPLAAVDQKRAYRALQAAFPDASASTEDGLRLTWPDRWIHLRPSGTEPIIRVIAEARTRDAAQALVTQGRAALPPA